MILIVEIVHLHQVGFHLLVELVGHTCTAHVAGPRFSPLPAYWTGLNNVGNVVESYLRNSDSIEESPHCDLRRVPPPNVEFADFSTDLRVTAGAKHPETVIDIERCPIRTDVCTGSTIDHPRLYLAWTSVRPSAGWRRISRGSGS